MENIVGLIDMDGFWIEKKFCCKELGLMGMDYSEALSFLFKIPHEWGKLSTKDKKHCSYVTKHIHKLPFYGPEGIPLHEANEIDTIVKSFYKNTRRNGNSSMAYKGGCIEKNLLQKNNIPHINLEVFGCPKPSQLVPWIITDQHNTDNTWMQTCGNHLEKNAYEHCPKSELEIINKWVKYMNMQTLKR